MKNTRNASFGMLTLTVCFALTLGGCGLVTHPQNSTSEGEPIVATADPVLSVTDTIDLSSETEPAPTTEAPKPTETTKPTEAPKPTEPKKKSAEEVMEELQNKPDRNGFDLTTCHYEDVDGMQVPFPAYFNKKDENNGAVIYGGIDHNAVVGFTSYSMEAEISEAVFNLKKSELLDSIYQKDKDTVICESTEAAVDGKKAQIALTVNQVKNEVSVTALLLNDNKLTALLYVQSIDADYNYLPDFARSIDNISLNQVEPVTISNAYLSTDYSGKQVLVVEYTFTNTSNQNQTFAFTYTDKVFQNGVQCEAAYFVDGVDAGAYTREVQPGGTLTVGMAYYLTDTTDVTVQVCKFLSSTPIATKTVKVQ